MKLKYKDLIALTAQGPVPNPALSKLLTADYERGVIPLSKIVCDMQQGLKSASQHWREFEDARQKMLAAFDREDKDWRTNPEQRTEFEVEFAVLMETEVELHLTPQPESLIDQAAELKFSAVDREMVSWFFAEAEEPEQAQAAKA